MITMLYVLLGVAAGVLQARSLALAARGGGNLFGPLARIVAVGAVLAVAARAGTLALAAAGWGLGFVGAAAVIAWRMR